MEFWSEEVVDLIGQITFSIGQLRIMQNVLLAILARLSELRGGPASLADAIKKGLKGFQSSIARAVVEYWNSGGSTVKNYRDLDQHFLAIARQSAVRLVPELDLQVYLPDDSTARTRWRPRFTGRVEAIQFLFKGYGDLERLTDHCLELHGIAAQPVPLVVPVTLHVSTI